MSTRAPMTSAIPRSASMRPPSNSWPMSRSRCPWHRSDRSGRITNTSAVGCAISSSKHGSWLDMAEIELAILSNQCLDRRIPDEATLTAEVAAWEQTRNETATRVDWRFTTADVRIMLRHLYPSH